MEPTVVTLFFHQCKGSPEQEHVCGRPLGIKVGPNGTLFVADAYLGLFEVNPVTGKIKKNIFLFVVVLLLLLFSIFSNQA